jgi:hypothetical protein
MGIPSSLGAVRDPLGYRGPTVRQWAPLPNPFLEGMVIVETDDAPATSTVCPKCGKPSWAPYVMEVRKKYDRVYRYKVYRHPDGRRRTPRKCTWKILEGQALSSKPNEPGRDPC